MFNDPRSTFFEGQKNKMAKFLADKGIYISDIIEEKKYHIVCTQWVHSLQWIFKSGPKLI